MSVTHVDLAYGQSAHGLLADERFVTQWRKLYDAIPHATAFQTPHFVRPWYRTYHAQWQPVIIHSQDSQSDLTGLWLLAHDQTTNTLVHAGAHQAEYHAWLALPGEDSSFLSAAWSKLIQQVEFATLRFKYLPAAASSILCSALGDEACGVVRPHSRPLLKLDPAEIKASFAKKSNKSRFNRLKKLGKLEFRRITDAGELEKVFDDLIVYYDFRQGAVNRTSPFHEDPLKRQFHLDLFSAAPAETCVTITYLDERPIAAFWGTASEDTVHLGMLVYSPFLAAHSPGKLHMMQLSDHLLDEGKNVIDLTPGGDPWKERFANTHDEVAEVTLYRSQRTRARVAATENLVRNAARCAAYVGITPARAKSTLSMLQRVRPSKLIKKVAGLIGVAREFRIYRCDRKLASIGHPDERVHCNSLADLLAFEPGESWQTRDIFLSSALARIEQGESAYTIRVANHLAHVGWMVTNQATSYMTEVKQSMTFPPGSVALYDFYSHPDFRGRGFYRATILHMLHAAFTNSNADYAYISVLADNLPSRHVIETTGFEYQGSFFWERRFGTEKKWQSPLLAHSEPAGA